MENQNNQNVNPASSVPPINQTPPVQTPSVSTPIIPPAGESKSKLPILIIGIILFLLVAGSAVGFYVFKQQSLKTAKSTPITIIQKLTPSPIPDPTANWKTFIGNNFKLSFPPECSLVDKFPGLSDLSGEKNITCKNFVIDPNAGGRGSFTPKTDNTVLNNITWERRRWQNGVQITPENATTFNGASYGFQKKDFGFLIEIEYQAYSKQIEQQVEQILSTFKFTDSTLTPTSTCMPRPTCLDATPRCMIAEPANGWCP